MDGLALKTHSRRKAAFLASLGAGLEYYDFIIYGLMAGYLSRIFFLYDTSWMALFKTFSVFATGYIIRPFGGLLFGLIGDTYGRKKTIVSVMLSMAIATICIGLLPTYEQGGIIAPISLIILRLLQGLSFGAELPGAITVVHEFTQKTKQGIYSGFVISSVTVGAILASIVLFLLTEIFNEEQILKYAWRLPFLLGGMLAIANYFIRKHLHETPAFYQLQNSRSSFSLKETFLMITSYSQQLILGVGITWFLASLVIFSIYLPTFLSNYYQYESKTIYLAMTCGITWAALILPICGKITDKIGKTRVLWSVCLLFFLGGFFLFKLLESGSTTSLIAFTVIYQTIISFFTTSYFPLLSNIFPTNIRYTGIAACYNVTYSIMGCLPIFMTLLISCTQTPASAIFFLLASSLISCASVWQLHRKSVLT